jgi:hypothetical protein
MAHGSRVTFVVVPGPSPRIKGTVLGAFSAQKPQVPFSDDKAVKFHVSRSHDCCWIEECTGIKGTRVLNGSKMTVSPAVVAHPAFDLFERHGRGSIGFAVHDVRVPRTDTGTGTGIVNALQSQ